MMCEQLLLKAAGGDACKDEFQTVTSFYGCDFYPRELDAHLSIFTHDILHAENMTFFNVLAYLRLLSLHQQQLLLQIIKLPKLILVMPATNTTNDWSFDILHCIKTYIRLNCLMLLYVHKTSEQCMVGVANDFVCELKHSLCIFGKIYHFQSYKYIGICKAKILLSSAPKCTIMAALFKISVLAGNCKVHE